MIERLTDDHHRIRRLADELDTYLLGDAPPADPGFARCRWELLRELSSHLAMERHALEHLSADQVERLPCSIDTGLSGALREHMVEWTGSTMHGGWIAYRGATQTLLRRLRRRMDLEERAIFPMLA